MPDKPRLLGNAPISGGWRLLSVEWPGAPLQPGHWLRVEQALLPVMNTSAGAASLLAAPDVSSVAALKPRQRYVVTGPHGTAWEMPQGDEAFVVVAGEAGIGAALFLCEHARPRLVLLEGTSMPFRAKPTQFVLDGLPPEAIAAAPVLEAKGIPSRLANPEGQPGCFEGDVVQLYQQLPAAFHEWPVYAALPAAALARLPSARLRATPFPAE